MRHTATPVSFSVRRLFAVPRAVAAWAFAWGVVLVVATTSTSADVQSEMDAAIRAADLKGTEIAFYVKDLDTGVTLAEQNADQLMIPASNMKLFTSASALGVLGADFVFETQLRLIQNQSNNAEKDAKAPGKTTDGATSSASPTGDQRRQKQGVVLLVRGDGDPAFGDSKMLERTPASALKGTPYEGRKLDIELMLQIWVDQVKARKIKRVDRLVMDDRVFDRELVHEQWPRDQLHRWYCAPVSGINFNTNCVDVYAEPTQFGQTPRIRIVPKTTHYTLNNRAVTGSAHTFWASRHIGTNQLVLAGKVKHAVTKPIHVTVHDPSLFLGHALADRLKSAGIAVASVARPATDEVFPRGVLLHRVRTSILDVVKRCNKDSQNLFAEAMSKRMGRKLTGTSGSWRSGAAAMRIFLRDKLGTRAARIQPIDGSGMSRGNRVTARVTVDLLRAMHVDKKLSLIYRNSLAVGGVDGSLAKSFDVTGMRGTLFAKTGYINGVRTLSGYVVIPAGRGRSRTIGFSLLFNGVKPPVYGHHVRTLRNRLVHLIDKHAL